MYGQLVDQAGGSQADIRATLDKLGVGYTPYYLVNGLAVDGGPLAKDVARFKTRSRAHNRQPGSPSSAGGHRRPLTGQADRPSDTPWNLTMIGADRVWDDFGVTGEGIVIGQSDSGAEEIHPELSDRYRGRDNGDDYNWFDPWNQTDPAD